MPRLDVRNVHSHRLRHLLKHDLGLWVVEAGNLVLADASSAEIIEHALFRFPGPHERLAKVGVLENQKQFHWKLLVVQEQVFLCCAAHSRQDLEDEVLYIDSALVGGWTLPMPPIENFQRYHTQELRLQATLCSNARPVLWRLCGSLSHTERYVPSLLLLLTTTRPKAASEWQEDA